ncbi:OmpH family outer membrane protein [Salipiger sp. 1_MG-2023]|uniref:OmpH family outer membrane protein n=1 Tax=Salipiger sp. 1_MG-2023 TaxID=3062665 RepID=UPI0026E3FA8C|nr:OmpH family outer membrane protein [Salipiger sp. 1_MG-2023]MDO6584600.1 OmpH family outer membrane protein [Salipiger sp. 1_MG-2023]
MISRHCAAVLIGLAGLSPAAHAQTAAQTGADQPNVVQSAVLTIEIDRLFSESAYGQRIGAELEAESNAIAVENRRIESELTEEERSLTEQRATLPQARFRELADAFDQKVQALRQEQDAKARALGTLSEESRRQFLALAEPVLGDIMQETGAAALLDKRSVFLSADAIDITSLAIARIDAAIGDGAESGLPDSPDN